MLAFSAGKTVDVLTTMLELKLPSLASLGTSSLTATVTFDFGAIAPLEGVAVSCPLVFVTLVKLTE
jgi:hypothetical protein